MPRRSSPETADARAGDVLKRAAGLAAHHLESLGEDPVVGAAHADDVTRRLRAAYRFSSPMPVDAVLDDVARMLRRGTVHGGHPSYFGPFHPKVATSAVAGATLLAAVNPQTAAAEHGAAAVAIEEHLLAHLGETLGVDRDGHARFTSGGQESNTEAVLLALSRAFPSFRDEGLRALPGQPVFYASDEAHHGLDKIASVLGLGRDALRRVGVDASHRIDRAALDAAIARDRSAGHLPFLIVATAGTPASGAIDPIDALADLAELRGIALHVDAAFGGGLAFSQSRRSALTGLARADSVTWDAHKWLRMPLGVGMLFARDRDAATRLFGTDARYLPRTRDDEPDPVHRGLAWSRPAAGVQLFVALAELGDAGFGAHVERSCDTAERLREKLVARGFALRNSSALPVVCFDAASVRGSDRAFSAWAGRLRMDGSFFAPPVRFADGSRALRACVTSAETSDADLDRLVDACSEGLVARD